ncbi:pirin family protein [Simiduia curdlanivorans]|uniref:Pirin family protein n=1 Tax=Simiduia curdlanivorans TaxID=1492769 RepID=A0ABV8V3T7_9GAMM|nr:pirin family protein [Simiduia curdlanivorans]MDN3638274.1 pirin family protein [Simiduia curdlanivorans]
MSNFSLTCEHECAVLDSCTAVALVTQPKKKDLDGFSVRRALPNAHRRMVGPWIFFDHMGPAHFEPGVGIDVRPHPHIGLSTVTYLFEGEILHRDSLGSYQSILPGDVNLMVAGKGITHSERERKEATLAPRTLHGLQLWLALPVAVEDIEPAFYHYPSMDIPEVIVDGVKIKIVMGSAFGHTSPVKVHCNTLYLELRLEAGERITLPDAEERALYVVQGEVKVKDSIIPINSMAFLDPARNLVIEATCATRLVLIGGESLGERFIEWNFVATDRNKIDQAKRAWVQREFPKVIDDEVEFIPLPGQSSA